MIPGPYRFQAKECKDKFETGLIEGLTMSKLDDFSIIASKFVDWKNYTITNADKVKLIEHLSIVKSWTKEFQPRVERCFELIGIPASSILE